MLHCSFPNTPHTAHRTQKTLMHHKMFAISLVRKWESATSVCYGSVKPGQKTKKWANSNQWNKKQIMTKAEKFFFPMILLL